MKLVVCTCILFKFELKRFFKRIFKRLLNRYPRDLEPSAPPEEETPPRLALDVRQYLLASIASVLVQLEETSPDAVVLNRR